ncbi:Ppx/GppA phosphatase family protein [Ornithobacterium rhinotracheale]
MIFEPELKEYVYDKNSYLYIDVGGVSTELTVLAPGKVLSTRSFDVGTVRWLNG